MHAHRDSWAGFVRGLEEAGELLEDATATLSDAEQADGYRALLRAVNNLLGRVETDAAAPELTPFNGWRQKFFMDNPDYRYWISDISGAHSYRIHGNIGDSVYQSVTAYTGRGVGDASAVARIDTDDLAVDGNGDFELTVSQQESASASHLTVPESTTSLWVRYIHRRCNPAEEGRCSITRTDAPGRPVAPDPVAVTRSLARLGRTVAQVPRVFELSTAEDVVSPNTVRHWTAMTGGAAFTEPGIHYVRGAWALAPDEALVLEGPLVPCRHWNIVLYSRFLNSLDYRNRTVTHTGDTATTAGDRFRFVLSAHDPGAPTHDWLDTEGRPFGIFVMRFLQPAAPPHLPDVTVVKRDELGPPA